MTATSYKAKQDITTLSSLRRLKLRLFDAPLRLVFGAAPQPAALPLLAASLQEIELALNVVFDASLLSSVTALTRLVLYRVSIEGQNGVSSGSAFLAGLAKLRELVELEVGHVLDVAWPDLSASAAQYSALLSSSKLTRLQMHGCGLPRGAWQHVFAPPCYLPALRDWSVSELEEQHAWPEVQAEVEFWGVEAVNGLVRCAQGLKDLYLCAVGGPPVAALSQPWGLAPMTSLTLYVDCTHDHTTMAASVRHVATLTGLHELHFYIFLDHERADADAGAVESAGALVPLTQLWQLSDLHVQVVSRETIQVEGDND